MPDDKTSVVECTETTAMNAWLKNLEGQQPERYEAKGTPVRDPSSQTKEFKCCFSALRHGQFKDVHSRIV